MLQRKVRLWTHPGCLGGRRARRYFMEKRIPFEEGAGQIQEAPSGYKGGLVVSPVIQVGEIFLYGFDAEEFERIYHQ